MKLGGEVRVCRQANVLPVKSEQRAMRFGAGVMIDPFSALPVRSSPGGISASRNGPRIGYELLLQPDAAIEDRVEISFVEKRCDLRREILSAVGVTDRVRKQSD